MSGVYLDHALSAGAQQPQQADAAQTKTVLFLVCSVGDVRIVYRYETQVTVTGGAVGCAVVDATALFDSVLYIGGEGAHLSLCSFLNR